MMAASKAGGPGVHRYTHKTAPPTMPATETGSTRSGGRGGGGGGGGSTRSGGGGGPRQPKAITWVKQVRAINTVVLTV